MGNRHAQGVDGQLQFFGQTKRGMVGTIKELGAHGDEEAINDFSRHTAASVVGGFKDRCLHPALAKGVGGGEPCRTAANDDDLPHALGRLN